MADANFIKPMTGPGGAFLVCVGLGILGFVISSEEIRYQVMGGGFAIGIVALTLVAILFRSPAGAPGRGHILLLWSLIAIELLVLWRAAPLFEGFREQMLFVFTVVGLHFLPMLWTHGSRIAALGVLMLAVSITGWLAPAIPIQGILALHGALMVLFGGWMVTSIGQRRSTSAGTGQ